MIVIPATAGTHHFRGTKKAPTQPCFCMSSHKNPVYDRIFLVLFRIVSQSASARPEKIFTRSKFGPKCDIIKL
ncbi:hypothetical protein DLM77_04655 [Leptospira yasudae]|uniref:Uncharacterized protein n=1 Tax=Leptospira yasudae TaxID=2202201 RepID=A0ABX9M8C0_9LEPT|nr:hypothetical protein DLM77_04655 [Leptospira yasudae]